MIDIRDKPSSCILCVCVCVYILDDVKGYHIRTWSSMVLHCHCVIYAALLSLNIQKCLISGSVIVSNYPLAKKARISFQSPLWSPTRCCQCVKSSISPPTPTPIHSLTNWWYLWEHNSFIPRYQEAWGKAISAHTHSHTHALTRTCTHIHMIFISYNWKCSEFMTHKS